MHFSKLLSTKLRKVPFFFRRDILIQSYIALFLSLFFGPLECIWVHAADVDSYIRTQEDKAVLMDEIIITARGMESALSATPGGTDRIGSEEIFEIHPVNASDAAARSPGVHITSDSPWGSDINIRGLSRDSVILLLDGSRVNTATDINARFGFVNPMEIQSIEILKGPISALYGSGSTGGVVNILTKKGEFDSTPQWHGEFIGSISDNPFGSDTYANISYNSPDAWVYGSAGRRDHDSYDDGDGHEVGNSQFEDAYLKLAASRKWHNLNITEIEVQQSTGSEIGIPGSGTASLPSQADVTYPDTRQQSFRLSHTIHPEEGPISETRINAYFFSIDRNVRIDHPSSSVLEIRPSADHRTWGVQCQNVLDIDSHQLVFGVDAWNWQMESIRQYFYRSGAFGQNQPTPNADEFSGGIFCEDNWKIHDRLSLNFGGRIDYIRVENDSSYTWIVKPSSSVSNPILWQSGAEEDVSWNAHAGAAWEFAPHWCMTALAASSYRAPNILERFQYLTLAGQVVQKGNPDLDSERSIFFEYGLHYKTAAFDLSAGIFANFLEDLIVAEKKSDVLYQNENVSSAEIYGSELEMRWRFSPDWTLYANLAHAQGRNTAKDEDLADIPPLNGMTGIRYENRNDFWSQLELQWAADQDRVPSGTEESSGWAILNASIGYRFKIENTWHDIILTAKNIADADYDDYLSTCRGIVLKEPGQSFTITWRIAF